MMLASSSSYCWCRHLVLASIKSAAWRGPRSSIEMAKSFLPSALSPVSSSILLQQQHQQLFSSSSSSSDTNQQQEQKQHIVIALGGNALLKRGQAMTMDHQRQNIRNGMARIAPIVAKHKITLVHGNGPQVGLLALQDAEYQTKAAKEAATNNNNNNNMMSLDILDAETEGMIGYMLEQELQPYLPQGRGMATVLSQIVVNPQDEAFQNPTKFIGPVYTKEQVEELGISREQVKMDGEYFRKVVPSPLPVKMLDAQQRAIQLLTDQDCIVICAGGGGIPVVEIIDTTGDNTNKEIRGIEAVIDKDRAAAMVAKDVVGADGLLILTDVPAVATNFLGSSPADKEQQRYIQSISTHQLHLLLEQGHFPAGSMGPKVESAIDFVESTTTTTTSSGKNNKWCAIGSLQNADQIVIMPSSSFGAGGNGNNNKAHHGGTMVTNAFGPNHVVYY